MSLSQKARIAVLYALFAGFSMVVNLGTQALVFRLNPFVTGALMVGVIAGTGTGLISKYVLDKRYIFRFRSVSIAADGCTFALYTAMGIVTTLIFWGMEWSADRWVPIAYARFWGGATGLTIGYILKYRLDKRFVFRSMECR